MDAADMKAAAAGELKYDNRLVGGEPSSEKQLAPELAMAEWCRMGCDRGELREGKYAATDVKFEGTLAETKLLTLRQEAVPVADERILGEETGEMVPCEATEMLLLARLCSLGDSFESMASLLVLVSVLLLWLL